LNQDVEKYQFVKNVAICDFNTSCIFIFVILRVVLHLTNQKKF